MEAQIATAVCLALQMSHMAKAWSAANMVAARGGLVSKVEVVDDMAHVHGLVVERVARRLGQEVQRARHLLDQHKA